MNTDTETRDLFAIIIMLGIGIVFCWTVNENHALKAKVAQLESEQHK